MHRHWNVHWFKWADFMHEKQLIYFISGYPVQPYPERGHSSSWIYMHYACTEMCKIKVSWNYACYSDFVQENAGIRISLTNLFPVYQLIKKITYRHDHVACNSVNS